MNGGKMDSPLVECIPNFSEGRRPEVVEEIVNAIRSVAGVVLLNYSSDHDHNRSVITFVGSPQAVEDAAFASIAKAADLIDLEKHEGEHPRIGAADVVPLVPIAGVTMKACVEIAQRLGKRVGEELGIPVYLYEKAATQSDRKNLENVRKGEYEGLKEDIKTDPSRTPDYGPSQIGSAGATVIGARSPLIAYNVYLDTDDVTVAEKIGRSVRHSSGGLRYVKGLGMLVDGKAQVSMNLTNYERTPVYRVVEMIRREAARYGADITHSELIGLIPQKALTDAAAWYLQLDDFSEDQVLESCIQSAQAEGKGKLGVDTGFLDLLAAGKSTPGGGSAAAYSGAMAAGLVVMVARLTINKKKYKDVENRMGEIIEEAEKLRNEMTASVEKDAAAYDKVVAAFRLPKTTKKEIDTRKKAIQDTTLKATQAPLEVANMAVSVLSLALEVAEKGNPNAITDAGTGAALGLASLRGASMNVRINLDSLDDQSKVKKFSSEIEALEKQAATLQTSLQDVMEERGGLPFI
jgi:glutamate formiminotransferase/formiminotetrahydrofolate cyclodeaminase